MSLPGQGTAEGVPAAGRGLNAERQAIVAKHRWERNFYESDVPPAGGWYPAL